MPQWLRSFASAAVLLCAAVVTACKCAPEPPRVTDEMRAGFGEVAVVAADSFCEVSMEHGLTGANAGMGSGFERGVSALWKWPLAVIDAGARGTSGAGALGVAVYGVVVLAATAGAFAAAVIYIPVSTAAGGRTAIPADDAAAAQAVLVATAQDFADSGRIADAVVSGERERRGRGVVERDAADTIVKIYVEAIRRGEMEGWLSYDRPFAIETEARAAIFRRGTVLWSRKHSTRDDAFEAARRALVTDSPSASHEHTYLEWAADGGAPLRTELATQSAVFGALFVEEIFGPLPEPRQAAPAADR